MDVSRYRRVMHYYRTTFSGRIFRPELQVSHETVYKAIYAQPHGELRKELIACLRQGHTKRRPRAGGVDRRQ